MPSRVDELSWQYFPLTLAACYCILMVLMSVGVVESCPSNHSMCDEVHITAVCHGTGESLEYVHKGEQLAANKHVAKVSVLQRAVFQQGMLEEKEVSSPLCDACWGLSCLEHGFRTGRPVVEMMPSNCIDSGNHMPCGDRRSRANICAWFGRKCGRVPSGSNRTACMTSLRLMAVAVAVRRLLRTCSCTRRLVPSL